jgi:hypothetical protein
VPPAAGGRRDGHGADIDVYAAAALDGTDLSEAADLPAELVLLPDSGPAVSRA